MNWKEKAFKNFRLYGVTDLKASDSRALKAIEEACRGGVDIIQLRSKALSDAELFEAGKKIKKIAHANRKLFFVNDRLDLALALEADGVHLGQDDLPIATARKLGKELLVGKSTHSLKQAIEAEKEGADYIGVGPVYGTPTKPTYTPVGLQLVKQVKSEIRIPFVAIGGIDPGNLNEVLEAGAERVAMVRAIWGAKHIYEDTSETRKKIETFRRARR